MQMAAQAANTATWVIARNGFIAESILACTNGAAGIRAASRDESKSLRSADARPPEMSVLQEGEWVERSTTGDHRAFDALVRAYGTRVYTHIFRIVGNREESEDLTQETFLRAYRSFASYDVSRSFKSWIYAIATRVALNALRAKRRRGEAVPMQGEADEQEWRRTESTCEGPRQNAARADIQDRLAKALLVLSPRSAALMHMHYYEGMTLREAASVLSISEEAAKVALHRARKKLRELLIDEDWRDAL